MTEMRRLIEILNAASKAYYCGGQYIMSDKKFDLLYDKLKRLERTTGIVLPDSPTQKVGYEVKSNLIKVKHERRSLSLEKTKEKNDMVKWLGKHQGVLSWKCDGLTVILTYDNGKLIKAATRGNGNLGEDITHNALHFEGVLRNINDNRHIVIRGEAVITYDSFRKINGSLPAEKKYRNPRGMASGSVRLLDSQKSAKYQIRFIPYDHANALDLGIERVSESLKFISNLGMKPVEWSIVDAENVVDAIQIRENAVGNLPYPTDGLVIVYDDLRLCNAVGETSKYPKYAKAFKWQDVSKTTVLRKIEWSVAKSGILSPVAVFDPVGIDGTTIKRASVHNISSMKNLKLGIGDHIKVYKANMIIPQIEEDLEKRDNVQIPTVCPECGMKLIKKIGRNNRTEFLYCINDQCPAKGEKRNESITQSEKEGVQN